MTRAAAFAVAALAAIGLWASSPRVSAQSQGSAAGQVVGPLDAGVTPLTSKNVAGHHLWIIVFDKGAMQSEDIRRAAGDALTWTREKTANVDVVAVAIISSTGLEILQDFTTDDSKVQRALASFNNGPVDAAATRLAAGATDLDSLSSDFRLGGMKTICDAMKAWPAPKDMLYFTAGLSSDADNSLSYRDAVAACEKAHVTIDSIDARGLVASGRGTGLGRGGLPAPVGRGEPLFDALTPPPAAQAPGKPDFSGSWVCDACPQSLSGSSAALWLGPAFTIRYQPAGAIAFQAAAPGRMAWTFELSGSRSVNTAAPAFDGDWVSTLSWAGDTLVLSLAGTVSNGGAPTSVVEREVLSLLTADGPRKGELEVVTTSAPAVLPAGVSFYKKIN